MGELEAWVNAPGVEFARQKEIVAALAMTKSKTVTPVLVSLLDDVRMRGDAAEALGKLGDASAKAALLAHFIDERYVGVRPREARALLALGATKEELAAPLEKYAGLPEAMLGALDIARAASLLTPAHDATKLRAPNDANGPLRLGVLGEDHGSIEVEVDGASRTGEGPELWLDLPTHGEVVTVRAKSAVVGYWLVRAGRAERF